MRPLSEWWTRLQRQRSDKKGYRAKIKVGADGDIFELVENAQYDGSKPEKGKRITAHKGVGYWDYFIKNVQIDEVVFDLTANVRKRTDGEFVYSIQLNENKKIKASPPLGLLLKASNGVTNASNSMVAQPNTDVKMYSDRSTDSVSNRTLLADALESTTQHDVERKKLQEYKSKMPNKDVAEIQSLIKHEAKTSDNYLGIDAKWLYNTEKGHEYFAIYSTTNVKDPTILYASKGKSANREYKFVQEFPKREEQRYGQDYGAGGLVGQLLSRFKDAASWQNVYDRNTARSGSSSRNGAVYSQNRRDKLNAAFLSCIKNISETQLQASIDERYQFAVDRGDLKTAQRMVDEAAEAAGYSIKGYHGRVN